MSDRPMAGETSRNIDWDAVGAYYDAYVRTELDVPWFLDRARATGGPVLELMCGTGRISLPLIEAGFDLTGVDSSAELLARFRAKLAQRGLAAELVEADVRELALGRRFALVFVGFHALSEVLGAAERRRALAVMRDHVRDTGRLVVTLHNPTVRAAAAHEDWRTMGVFPLAPGRSVEISSRWTVDLARGRMHGAQRYRELEAERCVKELSLPIVFDLVTRAEIEEHASALGLRVTDIRGDYEGGDFDAEASPFQLFELAPAALA